MAFGQPSATVTGIRDMFSPLSSALTRPNPIQTAGESSQGTVPVITPGSNPTSPSYFTPPPPAATIQPFSSAGSSSNFLNGLAGTTTGQTPTATVPGSSGYTPTTQAPQSTIPGNTNLPYVDVNNPNQPIQLATPRESNTLQGQQSSGYQMPTIAPVASGYTPQAGNEAVLKAAQDRVLNQTPSALPGVTEQKTLDYLNDPMQGFNTDAYKAQQMEAYKRSQAQSLEALRQATGGMAHTGQNISDLVGVAMQNEADRAKFGSDLDRQMFEQKQTAFLNSLAQGRETGTNVTDIASKGIQDLVNVRGAAEGGENRTFTAAENAVNRGVEIATNIGDKNFQEDMTRLQGDISMGEILTKGDIDSYRQSIDNQLKIAMQKNDIVAQQQLTTLKASLDEVAAQNQRNWETMDRQDQNAWLADQRDIDRNMEVQFKNIDTSLAEQELGISRERLLLEAYQFDSRQDFDAWLANAELDNYERDRIWKATEAVKDRQFEADQMELERAFTERGMNFDALMQSIEGLPAEQAAQVLNQAAVDSGLTYKDPITGETKRGLMPQSVAAQASVNSSDVMTAIEAGANLNAPITMPDGTQISMYDYAVKYMKGDFPNITTDMFKTEKTYDARDSFGGTRANRFTSESWNALNAMIGETISGVSGNLFQLVDVVEQGKNEEAYSVEPHIVVKNIKTGQVQTVSAGQLSNL